MRKLFARALCVGSLCVVGPSIARAEPPASVVVAGLDDEVTLKDGGAVRGVVVSVEPGKGVTIVVPGQKEPRAIPWSQVADVQKGKYAAKATVDPGAAGEGYGDAPAPRKGAPAANPAHPVEAARADEPNVAIADDAAPKPTASPGRRVAGWLLLTLGPAVAVAGSLPLITKGIECSAGCTKDVYEDVVPEIVGGTFITLGVGAFIGGIVLLATSGAGAKAADAPPIAMWVGSPNESDVAIAPAAPMTSPTVLGVKGAF